MSLFGNIGNTKKRETRRYLEAGVYKVEIQRTVMKEAREGGHVLALEFVVLESTNPEFSAGMNASQVILTRWADTWERHLRTFLEGAFAAKGLDLTDITPEATSEIFSGDGTELAGLVLEVEVVSRKTKRGGTFSEHHWRAPSSASIEVKPAPAPAAHNPFAPPAGV